MSSAWSCIRTRSPSSAPPENGEDGSTASTPTRLSGSRSAVTSAEVEVDLPTPGRAGDARRPARGRRTAPARPSPRAAAARRPRPARSAGRPRGRPPSRARSTRSGTDAAERRRPDAVSEPVEATSCRDADDQGVALAAATAERGRTGAAAAALELEREVQHDPGAGHADRVAQRDRAAVDVDLVVGDAELAGRRDADGGERLVELDQVEVGDAMPSFSQALADRVGRLQLQGGVGAGDLAVTRRSRRATRGRAPRPWPCSSRRPRRRRRRSARRSRR